MVRWSKLSVKLFMKQTIFFLILIIFVGCAQQNTLKPEAPTAIAEVTPLVASEPQTTNIVAEKAIDIPPPAVEAAPKASKKIDYDAINKSILKDVSKKIVDKASKKD
jgi:CheY-specific phosphatase CheX